MHDFHVFNSDTIAGIQNGISELVSSLRMRYPQVGISLESFSESEKLESFWAKVHTAVQNAIETIEDSLN